MSIKDMILILHNPYIENRRQYLLILAGRKPHGIPEMDRRTEMVARVQSKVGRNMPCPCGSGKKFKQCCLAKQSQKEDRRKAVGIWLLLGILLVMLLTVFAILVPDGEPSGVPNRVWDPEHGHYHDVP